MSATRTRPESQLSHTVRLARHHLSDKLLRPRATAPDDIPAFPWRIDPGWLSAIICPEGTRITRIDYEPVSSGSSHRSRLRLSYEGPAAAELPESLFVKSTPTLKTRLQVGGTGAMRAEARFYREIRPTIDVRAPLGYYGASDRRTGRSLLLLEDMTRTRHVEFGDPRTVPIDRVRADSMADTLGTLWGGVAGTDRFQNDLRWVVTSEHLQDGLNRLVDYRRRVLVGVERSAELLPSVLLDRRDRLQDDLMRTFAMDRTKRLGLVHTDVHSRNWFVQDGRDMGLYDWAAPAQGDGTRDLAYALMSGLATEDRRAWERELVAQWADAASRASGTAIPADEAWESYRVQTLHGLCFWLYTIGAGAMQPDMQPEEVSRINLQRMGQAIEDLDTFGALDRLAR
jgi:hypothetical protein